jgi:hypothetical protein
MSWIVILFSMVGCIPWTSSTPKSLPILSVQSVQPRTVIPVALAAENQNESTLLQIPNSLLSFSHVTQPAAEMREGPGSQFPLQGVLLETGDRVLVLDHYRKWVKVFQGDTGRSGWMHQQSLTPLSTQTGSFTVDTRALEALVVTPGRSLMSYPDQAIVPLPIPVGRVFFVLKKEKKRSLVWLPESQSVAWVSNQSCSRKTCK